MNSASSPSALKKPSSTAAVSGKYEGETTSETVMRIAFLLVEEPARLCTPPPERQEPPTPGLPVRRRMPTRHRRPRPAEEIPFDRADPRRRRRTDWPRGAGARFGVRL